jgi:hypothetical protein
MSLSLTNQVHHRMELLSTVPHFNSEPLSKNSLKISARMNARYPRQGVRLLGQDRRWQNAGVSEDARYDKRNLDNSEHGATTRALHR